MERSDPETVPRRADGLQIVEYTSLQRIVWVAERMAWVLFVALVVAAAAGFTGGGGSHARRQVEIAGATLDLPAVSRWIQADTMTVRFHEPAATHEIVLGTGFADLFAITGITPAPVEERHDSRGLRLVLAAPAGHAVLSLRARAPGILRYRIAIDGVDATGRVAVLP